LFRVRNRKKKKSPAWQEMAARLQIDQLRTGSQLTLHLSPYPTLFCFSKQKTKQRKITFSFGEWALLCGVCEPGIFYYLLFYFILAPLGHGRWCPKVTVTCSSNYYLLWVRSGYIFQALTPTYIHHKSIRVFGYFSHKLIESIQRPG
jgi:hypothetical protein